MVWKVKPENATYLYTLLCAYWWSIPTPATQDGNCLHIGRNPTDILDILVVLLEESAPRRHDLHPGRDFPKPILGYSWICLRETCPWFAAQPASFWIVHARRPGTTVSPIIWKPKLAWGRWCKFSGSCAQSKDTRVQETPDSFECTNELSVCNSNELSVCFGS
jgi:hypothetical protein